MASWGKIKEYGLTKACALSKKMTGVRTEKDTDTCKITILRVLGQIKRSFVHIFISYLLHYVHL